MLLIKDPTPFWFGLRVKPRHEKTAAAAVQSKGFETFVPLYRARRQWSDRIRELEAPLFPRYVFSRFAPQDRLRVLVTPGVEFVLGVGRTPAPVSEAEIAALKAIGKSGLIAEPWPFLEVGNFVRIDAGPLFGLQGILLEFRGRHRLVVSVNLLQRSVAVEVDRCWLSPLRAFHSVEGLRQECVP